MGNRDSEKFKDLSGHRDTALMGDFNPPDICWNDNTSGPVKENSGVSQEIQVLDGNSRVDAQLDLQFTGRTSEGLSKHLWIIFVSTVCSKHEITELKIEQVRSYGKKTQSAKLRKLVDL